MKKYVAVGFACLIGTVIALQLDRWINRPKANSPLIWGREVGRTVQNGTLAQLPDFREAAKRILPAVVSIDVVGVQQNFFYGSQEVADSGSGVIISSEGHIVTNSHVVLAGDRTSQITVHLSDGRSMDAELIGIDTRADLAILKIKADGLIPAFIGKSSELEVGQWVLAVGNPFRQENTVSAGIVGNIGRDVPVSRETWLMETIQTDASINPGNSGGAMTNSQGELVGINTAILSPNSTGSVGIGYAIPIDLAKPIIDDLIKYGRARYGTIGIEIAQRPGILQIPRAREQYKQETGFEPPANGALVISVTPGSSGETAHIQILDVITKVNERVIQDRDDFIKATYALRPNQKVQITVFSKGKTTSISLTAKEIQSL